MRVLLINQYYYPDIAATAQMCADLAEDLVALGHQVTVVAGTACYRTPHDGNRALSPAPLALSAEHRGVRILRVPIPAPFLSSALSRAGFSFAGARKLGDLAEKAMGYASFFFGAWLRILLAERPDVVLALSTPPLVAALGLWQKSLSDTRFVYWVQDVYPDLAVALGVMDPTGAAARFFDALSLKLYRSADAVVVLDEAMAARLIEKGASPGRVHVIDNWCDGAEVTPQPPGDNGLRRHLGLSGANGGDGQFAIGYAGNLGRGHDFDTLLAALPALANDPVSWIFIGGGPLRAAVEEGTKGLPRVHFLPPQSRAGVRDALTAGDVGLVTLSAGLSGLLVPSKVYGMLAAGRPILYVGPPGGRVAELLRREDIGESVRNDDVPGLIAAVRRLAADPSRRARMGARARQVFERSYTRGLATARHEAVLKLVAGSDKAARDPFVRGRDMQKQDKGGWS